MHNALDKPKNKLYAQNEFNYAIIKMNFTPNMFYDVIQYDLIDNERNELKS